MKTKNIPFNKTLTRLQPGFIVRGLAGADEWLVIYVNDSRASVVPRAKKSVTVKLTDKWGNEREFQARPTHGLDISPNSELEIVGVDQEWLKVQAALAALKKGAR